MPSESQSRIKINKHLESAGWRFFDTEADPANILTEYHTKITQHDLDSFGEDFEHNFPNSSSSNGISKSLSLL